MVNYEAVGNRIRKLRTDKGMTQEELAFRLGSSAAYLSNIENGIKKPSLTKLTDIARQLDVTLNDLIYEKDEEADPSDDELLKLLSSFEPEKVARLKTYIVNILQIISER